MTVHRYIPRSYTQANLIHTVNKGPVIQVNQSLRGRDKLAVNSAWSVLEPLETCQLSKTLVAGGTAGSSNGSSGIVKTKEKLKKDRLTI